MFRRLVLAGAGTALIAAAFAFALTASQWTTANALTNCSSSSAAWNANETQLFNLINAFRQQNGVALLKQSPTLANMAAWMAEDMAAHGGGVSNPPTHDDWSGRPYSSRASQCGSGGYNGENVGWGFGSPTAMFNGWAGSSGHRAAMLNPSFKVIGLGQVGTSWVADFSSIDDSGQSATTTALPTSATAPASATTAAATPTATTTAANTSPTIANTPLPTSTSKPIAPALPLRRAVLPLVSAE